jgi:hypothetical protein
MHGENRVKDSSETRRKGRAKQECIATYAMELRLLQAFISAAHRPWGGLLDTHVDERSCKKQVSNKPEARKQPHSVALRNAEDGGRMASRPSYV